MNELVEIQGPFRLESHALIVEESPSWEQWQTIGEDFILPVHHAHQWWIGDWLEIGERLWGDNCYQVVSQELDIPYETLRKYAQVSHYVPPQRRVPGLSWSHHRAVMWLEPQQQMRLLAEASPRGPDSPPALSVRELGERADQAEKGQQAGPQRLQGPDTLKLDEKIAKAVSRLYRLLDERADQVAMPDAVDAARQQLAASVQEWIDVSFRASEWR